MSFFQIIVLKHQTGEFFCKIQSSGYTKPKAEYYAPYKMVGYLSLPTKGHVVANEVSSLMMNLLHKYRYSPKHSFKGDSYSLIGNVFFEKRCIENIFQILSEHIKKSIENSEKKVNTTIESANSNLIIKEMELERTKKELFEITDSDAFFQSILHNKNPLLIKKFNDSILEHEYTKEIIPLLENKIKKLHFEVEEEKKRKREKEEESVKKYCFNDVYAVKMLLFTMRYFYYKKLNPSEISNFVFFEYEWNLNGYRKALEDLHSINPFCKCESCTDDKLRQEDYQEIMIKESKNSYENLDDDLIYNYEDDEITTVEEMMSFGWIPPWED